MGKRKRETESFLTAAQKKKNAIRTNYIKAQNKSKCKLCGNKDKTANRIINECSKQVQN